MPYTPVATDYSEPTDFEKASIMGQEFRTLKGYIQLTLVPLIAGKIGSGGGNFTGSVVGNANGAAYIARQTNNAALVGLQTQDSVGIRYLDVITLGVSHAGYAGAAAGDSLLNAVSGNLVLSTADTKRAWIDHAGVAHFNQTVDANIGGNAATATNASYASAAPWAGISSRPSGLSAFTNDAGFLTGPIAYSSLTGKPTALSQFINDLAGSGILSLNGRTASAATVISSDVTGALGYTPYSVGNPANFTTLSAVAAAGYQTSSGAVAAASTAYSVTGPSSNGYGTRTVSTSAPSGGSDGDIWYQVSS